MTHDTAIEVLLVSKNSRAIRHCLESGTPSEIPNFKPVRGQLLVNGYITEKSDNQRLQNPTCRRSNAPDNLWAVTTFAGAKTQEINEACQRTPMWKRKPQRSPPPTRRQVVPPSSNPPISSPALEFTCTRRYRQARTRSVSPSRTPLMVGYQFPKSN
jgi:hypothetical protein